MHSNLGLLFYYLIEIVQKNNDNIINILKTCLMYIQFICICKHRIFNYGINLKHACNSTHEVALKFNLHAGFNIRNAL